jgi:hypothetical protein
VGCRGRDPIQPTLRTTRKDALRTLGFLAWCVAGMAVRRGFGVVGSGTWGYAVVMISLRARRQKICDG